MKILNPRQLAAWVSLLASILSMQGALAEPISDSTQVPPRLVNLVKNTLTDHPDLQAAKADFLSAKAVLRASGQAVYNPELEIEYEDADVKTQTVGIRQTIDWGDQQGSRTGMAQAGLQQAVAEYEMNIQSLISNLLTALAQNQTGKELALLSNETLQLMQEFKDIAGRRYQAGDLSQVELNLARLAYSQALLSQASTLANSIEAREKLRALLGGLPSNLPDLPEALPEPKLNNELESFLQQLPVIRSQLAEVQVAREQVNLRKSEKAWNPTIGVSAGSEGEESLVGISLSIPLNIRNSFSAEVDVAQQDLIASQHRTQLAYREIRASLIATTERYRHLLNTWNAWREDSRSSVEQQLSLIKQLWKSGDISASDYLLQLKQALETQASGLGLRNQLWQVAFEWMSQTNTIDNWLNIEIDSSVKNK